MSDDYLPPVLVQMIGDWAPLLRTLTESKAALDKFDGTEAKVILGADGKPLLTVLPKIKAEAQAMVADPITVRIKLDKASAVGMIAEARAAGLAASLAASGGAKGSGIKGLMARLGFGAGPLGLAGFGTAAGMAGFGFEHILGAGRGCGCR